MRRAEHAQVTKQLQEQGIIPGPKAKGGIIAGAGSKVADAWFASQLLEMGVHAADSIVEGPAAVDTLQKKLGMAGVDDGGVKKAMARAEELSKKYKNMSIRDNLELINDARASITGSFDKILEDVDPFVRLGSFFKSYDGGSHASEGASLNKELQAAMMSGELLGKITGADLAKATDNLAAMKVLYGDKLDVKSYLTMQKAAGSSLMGMDDDFVYGMLPAVTQSLGPRAGTGLMTLQNKILAGINNRAGALEFGLKYGLIDPSKVEYSNNGKPKSVDYGGFIGADTFAHNPFKWVTGPLLDMVDKAVTDKGGHLPVAAMRKAIDAGDSDAYAKVLQGITPEDKGKMKWALGQLLRDRSAVNETIETLLQGPKLLKDQQNLLKVRKDFQDFNTYDKAKQEVSTSASNLWVKVTGDGFVPAVSGALKSLAHGMDYIGGVVDQMRKNAARQKAIDDRFNAVAEKQGSLAAYRDWWNGGAEKAEPHGGFANLHAAQESIARTQAVLSHAKTVIEAARSRTSDTAAQRMQIESKVKVEVPPAIKIDVGGALSSDGRGVVSGSGELPVSVMHPRGRTMATPPAPAVTR